MEDPGGADDSTGPARATEVEVTARLRRSLPSSRRGLAYAVTAVVAYYGLGFTWILTGNFWMCCTSEVVRPTVAWYSVAALITAVAGVALHRLARSRPRLAAFVRLVSISTAGAAIFTVAWVSLDYLASTA